MSKKHIRSRSRSWSSCAHERSIFWPNLERPLMSGSSVVDFNRVGVISGWLLAVATRMGCNLEVQPELNKKWVTTQKVTTQILFNRVDLRVEPGWIRKIFSCLLRYNRKEILLRLFVFYSFSVVIIFYQITDLYKKPIYTKILSRKK